MAHYQEMQVKSALYAPKRKLPYRWEIDPYRGCTHGCKYCYAVGSHRYLDGANFYEDIYVKTNLAEQLERELSRPGWKRETVCIGGVTDAYQPAEAQYRLMPDILRLFIRYRTPAIICTKSALVLRDYDLIDELSRLTYVNIAETVTTMDEAVRRRLEPNGAPSARRIEVLRTFRKTNASIGMHIMPIVPRLTDSSENMEALLSAAKEADVHYVLPGMMYLRGDTRGVFFEFIAREYPALLDELRTLYKTGGAERHYKTAFYEMFGELRRRYGLSSNYTKPMQERLPQEDDGQLSLF